MGRAQRLLLLLLYTRLEWVDGHNNNPIVVGNKEEKFVHHAS